MFVEHGGMSMTPAIGARSRRAAQKCPETVFSRQWMSLHVEKS